MSVDISECEHPIALIEWLLAMRYEDRDPDKPSLIVVPNLTNGEAALYYWLLYWERVCALYPTLR